MSLVAVIGAGMAGMSATLFAANRNISTVQLGSASGLSFASGLLDLLGSYPSSEDKRCDDPWAAIKSLAKKNPQHPYSKISQRVIAASFEELLAFFTAGGFRYHSNQNNNSRLFTAQGTIKPSYYVPQSMWNAVSAFEKKPPCLLIDFVGLREFSAHQIVESIIRKVAGISQRLNGAICTKCGHTKVFLSHHIYDALEEKMIKKIYDKLEKRKSKKSK